MYTHSPISVFSVFFLFPPSGRIRIMSASKGGRQTQCRCRRRYRAYIYDQLMTVVHPCQGPMTIISLLYTVDAKRETEQPRRDPTVNQLRNKNFCRKQVWLEYATSPLRTRAQDEEILLHFYFVCVCVCLTSHRQSCDIGWMSGRRLCRRVWELNDCAAHGTTTQTPLGWMKWCVQIN